MNRHYVAVVLACLCLVVLLAPSVQAAPRAGADGAVIRSAQSGPWSAAATWEGQQRPIAGSVVLVRSGHTVTYDVDSDDVIRSIHLSGTLTFAPDRTTRLDVGLIRIEAGNAVIEEGFDCDRVRHAAPAAGHAGHGQHAGHGPHGAAGPTGAWQDGEAALLVGTPDRPIDAAHTAWIRLHYIPGMDADSAPAIVTCGARMAFHGARMDRTWVKLGDTAYRDDAQLVLAEPVTDWQVGDHIIITGSSGNFGGMAPQTEERWIVALRGNRVQLDRPVDYYHSGEGEFRAEVANLTRNVVVASADPQGVRGHTMYHRHSTGSISYAEFRHLGKRGILGRYPVHYHMCQDTMRGSSVVGASIWDSHNRWVAIHSTQYVVVRDTVGYKSIGHGFFLEDGTEVYNVFDRNLAVRADHGEPLPGQTLPFDKNDGAGFWWANSLNTFTRNIAADCAGYGFRYEATPRAGFDEDGQTYGSPDQPFDLAMPILKPDGSRVVVDIRTMPFVRFESNTAHNIANYALNLGEGTAGVGPDRDHPFVIRDMKIWNAQRGYTVHVPHVRVDGMHIHRCGYEVYRARYMGQDYRNVQLTAIQGQYEVFDLDSYLASGEAADQPGVGLNRARLPGFPRGTGAGGTSYRGAQEETAVLEPVDDLAPTTVITQVRQEAGQLLVRGSTADNGELARVLVNGQPARLLDGYGNWQLSLPTPADGGVSLSAHAEDAAGNIEQAAHTMTVAVR